MEERAMRDQRIQELEAPPERPLPSDTPPAQS
jgi:hypothetical protein